MNALKSFLYRLLSVQTFFQLGNNKILGLSNLYMMICISIVFGSTTVGFYGIRGIVDYTLWLPLAPFLLLGTLFVTNKWTVGVVSKKVQDRFPLTQLARFRDPAYMYLKKQYENWLFKEEELEAIWENTFGISYDEAIADQPFLQRARVLFMFGAGVGGAAVGMLVGAII